jgi:hypothetical protein
MPWGRRVSRPAKEAPVPETELVTTA